MLEIEFRILCMLDKCSTPEPQLSPDIQVLSRLPGIQNFTTGKATSNPKCWLPLHLIAKYAEKFTTHMQLAGASFPTIFGRILPQQALVQLETPGKWQHPDTKGHPVV